MLGHLDAWMLGGTTSASVRDQDVAHATAVREVASSATRLAGALCLRRPPIKDASGPYRGARPDDVAVVLASIGMVTVTPLALAAITSRESLRDQVARVASHAFSHRNDVAGYVVCMPGNPGDALDLAQVVAAYPPPLLFDLRG